MELKEFIEMKNEGNEVAQYSFRIPLNSPFKIENLKGSVDPGKTKHVGIVYHP